MNAEATKPYGAALLAYYKGDFDAELIIRREDGFESSLPVKHFFRAESEFSTIELTAMEQCRGHVLDVGSGIGLHSIELESRGLDVMAIDICSEAVDIMHHRGVHNGQQADVFEYQGGPFDTLFIMGHGIGIVEDLVGLQRFLEHAKSLVKPDGQLFLDSLDVGRSKEPADLAYHATNRKAGRYIGEIAMQFEFKGSRGPYCRWLHIDRGTLEDYAREAGWNCETILENENGEYLARLQKM
ncbi:MAG: class I SAM-dependent methyltransferase [Bacteroidota bacterium]